MKSMRYVLSLSMLLSAPLVVAMNDQSPADTVLTAEDMEARTKHTQWLGGISKHKETFAASITELDYPQQLKDARIQARLRRANEVEQHQKNFQTSLENITSSPLLKDALLQARVRQAKKTEKHKKSFEKCLSSLQPAQEHIYESWKQHRKQMVEALEEKRAKQFKPTTLEIQKNDQLLAEHAEYKSNNIASQAAIAAISKAEAAAQKLVQTAQTNDSWSCVKARIKSIKEAKKAAAKGTSWIFGSSTTEGEAPKPKSTTIKAAPEVSDSGLTSVFMASNAIGNAFSTINQTVTPIHKALVELHSILNGCENNSNDIVAMHKDIAAKKEWLTKAQYLIGNIGALDLTSNKELVGAADQVLADADKLIVTAMLRTHKAYTTMLNEHSILRSNIHPGTKPVTHYEIAALVKLMEEYEKTQAQK